MIGIKGRRILRVNSNPNPGSDVVKITLTLANSVSPTISFADMKYNKRTGMCICADDGYSTDYSCLYAYLKGGIPDISGITHSGIRGTDGCGNAVPWHATFAINGGERDTHAGDKTTWAEYREMIANGFDMSNHSRDHSGYDKFYEIRECEKIIFNNTGFRTRTFVIPTADEGYSESAPSVGYLMVSSQFGADSADDNNSSGNENVVWGSRVDIKAINQQRLNKFLFSRHFSFNDANTAAGIKEMANEVFNASSSGAKKVMGHFGIHGTSVANKVDPYLIDIISYMQNHPNGGDNMWIPTLQEFVEYVETKLNVVKKTTVTGNTMVLELDYSTLSKAGKYRDLSLILSGANISAIQVEGADNYTYNTQTGLINIYKKNTAVTDPNDDFTPPQIVEAIKSGNKILLTYDRPVTQNKFSSTYGQAYNVPGNSILSVTGSGTDWAINCQNPVAGNQTFDYRMQRGNAADMQGVKVCSYIGYPLV